MRRLWAVVLLNGNMQGGPIFGRDQAIAVACKLIMRGVPVSHICPIAREADSDIIKADELQQIAAERTTLLQPQL
jgi:hypothetical protein